MNDEYLVYHCKGSFSSTEDGISPAEYEWRQLKGFIDYGCKTWCMNCHSQVFLFEGPHDNCPNDECYNFARGVDFWLTGQEWMYDETSSQILS